MLKVSTLDYKRLLYENGIDTIKISFRIFTRRVRTYEVEVFMLDGRRLALKRVRDYAVNGYVKDEEGLRKLVKIITEFMSNFS